MKVDRIRKNIERKETNLVNNDNKKTLKQL